MPSFDVVSEVDTQEIRNALDQARREVANRFDFKGTDSTIDWSGDELVIESSTPERLEALKVVIEEKLVRRKVSLKAFQWGEPTDAAKGRTRRRATIVAGISADKAREINKAIKDLGIKGVQSQTQGDQVRVSHKKRDALQEVIAALRERDFGIPLQFTNFRD